MNKITLIGYVGAEPEIHLTSQSDPVCSFRVATNERLPDGKDHTEWFSVVTFGKTALYCSKRISKGSRVYLEGKVRTESYIDSSSQKRFTLKVYPAEILVLDSIKNEPPEDQVLVLENASD